MTGETAYDYIRRRMKELGYGDNYTIRFRHLVMQPSEIRTFAMTAQLIVLAEPKEGIRIESGTGLFDLADTATNELQYEHQGTVTVTNYSAVTQQVLFIQALY